MYVSGGDSQFTTRDPMEDANLTGKRNPMNLMKESDRLIRLGAANAMSDIELGKYGEAVSWIEFAATVGWHNYPGYFFHPGLEKALYDIGRIGLEPSSKPLCPEDMSPNNSHSQVLHVMTAAHAIGGHTRAVADWISNCSDASSGMKHSILLTSQGSTELPDWLSSATSTTGGTCTLLDPGIPSLERAVTLRSIAQRHSDIVILHIHPNDPLAGIAFSDPGRKFPVLFFNHADHVFSIGQSVADFVLDFRKSGQKVSINERGCSARCRMVPIPMKVPVDSSFKGPTERYNLRSKARAILGIPRETTVALTIGSEYKFKPALGYDFTRAVRDVLSKINDAHLYAIGIPNSGPWKELSEDLDGRFHPVGEVWGRKKVGEYYAASDLYMEGYPFGSLTAMLEAGLFALPIQRMMNSDAPILSGDDVSLDDIVSPALSEGQYIEATTRMLKMSNEDRFKLGIEIRRSVMRDHCGPSWFQKWFEPVMNEALAQRRRPMERSVDYSFETSPKPNESTRDCQLVLTSSSHNPPETMILRGLNGVTFASLGILLELIGRSLARREPIRFPGEATRLLAGVGARFPRRWHGEA